MLSYCNLYKINLLLFKLCAQLYTRLDHKIKWHNFKKIINIHFALKYS